jgi:extracellular elastinolytic metalloproteinase
VPSSKPTLSLEDAIAKAETMLGGKFNEWPATLEFIAKEDGSVALAHVVQIQNDETGAWIEAFIDAHSGDLVHVTDFVTKASVSVILLATSST